MAGKINKAEQMMKVLAKFINMAGEIHSTDVAAAIVSNKHHERTGFPMLWGFYEENLHRPLVNCRIETARVKPI